MDLRLDNNKIETISATYLDKLVNLQNLNLNTNNKLNTFPDCIGPANTLKFLLLSSCSISTFPTLNKFVSLEKIDLNGNPIKMIPQTKLNGLDSLQSLYLGETDLAEVPPLFDVGDTLKSLFLHRNYMLVNAPASHVGGLRALTTLKLTKTPLESLPTTCTDNLSALTINATGSARKLCACDNAWLKQAAERGATINVGNVTCGSQSWSALNTSGLLSVCSMGKGEK